MNEFSYYIIIGIGVGKEYEINYKNRVERKRKDMNFSRI